MNLKDCAKNSITMPVALHWNVEQDENVLLEQLKAELALEREKNSLLATELAQIQQRSQHLECCLGLLCNSSKPSIPKVESCSSFSTAPDYKPEDIEEPPRIGEYSPQIRALKIQRYKEKLKRYRASVHVSRKFGGRSKVAKQKPRIKGKFVKS